MAKKTTPTKPPEVRHNNSAGLELLLMIAFMLGFSVLAYAVFIK